MHGSKKTVAAASVLPFFTIYLSIYLSINLIYSDLIYADLIYSDLIYSDLI